MRPSVFLSVGVVRYGWASSWGLSVNDIYNMIYARRDIYIYYDVNKHDIY